MERNSNEQIVVSCVIPTHARDDLLREALLSVRAQVAEISFEIIVVDDLDSPTAKQVVHDLNSNGLDQRPIRYVTYSVTDQVGGASRSRNVGAKSARGQFIAFLDDDDLWEPNYLERAAAELEQSGAEMAVTWMKVMERSGVITPLLSIRDGLVPHQVVARNPGVTGSNIVVSATAFRALDGFDEALPVSNDKDFFLRFLLDNHSYVAVRAENAIHRRHHGEQLTRPNSRRADGLEAYLEKHGSLMSSTDRRFLKRHIHRIRSRTSSTRPLRMFHAVASYWNSSPADVAARLGKRRSGVGRYTSV